MENKQIHTSIEKTATRHHLRVMAFVVCAVLLVLSAGYGLFAIVGHAEILATNSAHPLAEQLGAVDELHKMDANGALPLLALVFVFLLAPGLFKAAMDHKNNKAI